MSTWQLCKKLFTIRHIVQIENAFAINKMDSRAASHDLFEFVASHDP